MPIKNQFKPLPEIDLPFLNAWRDKMLERAVQLGIKVPSQRELIDFKQLFEDVKKASLLQRQKLNEFTEQTDKNISNLQRYGHFNIAKKIRDLKSLVIRKIDCTFQIHSRD